MVKQAVQERRRSNRTPMELGIQVYAYGMLVASGMTVEMSDHGMLLRIEQDYSADALDPGKHLDVMWEESCERLPTERWIPIKVVRKWDEGIAARFVWMDKQLC